jgi:ribonucleoside-triphosphate reductase
VSRIVGYFSRITNWNKSKLGELKDRHRGNYSVAASFPAAAPSAAASAPPPHVELGTAAG